MLREGEPAKSAKLRLANKILTRFRPITLHQTTYTRLSVYRQSGYSRLVILLAQLLPPVGGSPGEEREYAC